MAYDFFSEKPIRMVELKINTIIGNNRHLTNALDRGVNHRLIRKYSKIPFT